MKNWLNKNNLSTLTIGNNYLQPKGYGKKLFPIFIII